MQNKVLLQQKKKKREIYFLEAKTTKGLEFDYVFILDFSVFYYPHKDEMADLDKSKKDSSEGFNDDKQDIEEKEKRILYVSLTRTRQVVFLYYINTQKITNQKSHRL